MPIIQTLYRLGPNYVGSLQAPGVYMVTYYTVDSVAQKLALRFTAREVISQMLQLPGDA